MHRTHACTTTNNRGARGQPPAQDGDARADGGLRSVQHQPPRAADWRHQPAGGAFF